MNMFGMGDAFDTFVLVSAKNKEKVLHYYNEYGMNLYEILEVLNLKPGDFTGIDWSELVNKLPLG